MSEDRVGGPGRAANRHEDANAKSLGAADWLSLAAAPAFAIMALLTAGFGGPPDMHPSPLGGMAVMYLLMGAFHSAPWLKLISQRNRLGAGTAARRGGSA